MTKKNSLNIWGAIDIQKKKWKIGRVGLDKTVGM
jgi:hypothetical protein